MKHVFTRKRDITDRWALQRQDSARQAGQITRLSFEGRFLRSYSTVIATLWGRPGYSLALITSTHYSMTTAHHVQQAKISARECIVVDSLLTGYLTQYGDEPTKIPAKAHKHNRQAFWTEYWKEILKDERRPEEKRDPDSVPYVRGRVDQYCEFFGRKWGEFSEKNEEKYRQKARRKIAQERRLAGKRGAVTRRMREKEIDNIRYLCGVGEMMTQAQPAWNRRDPVEIPVKVITELWDYYERANKAWALQGLARHPNLPLQLAHLLIGRGKGHWLRQNPALPLWALESPDTFGRFLPETEESKAMREKLEAEAKEAEARRLAEEEDEKRLALLAAE